MSISATSITFRQRAGKLDWKTISSIDIDEIILKANVKELQAALDTVVFCEFSNFDVKSNTIESTAKLVNVLQLTSEYLLQCQEVQFKAIQNVNKKLDKTKHLNEKLKKEVISLKEDRKIYQRQLALLRKNAGSGLLDDNGVPRFSEVVLTKGERDTDYSDERKTPDSNVVESILRNEENNRVFMTNLLEEQRRNFVEQINQLVGNFHQQFDSVVNKNSKNNASLASPKAGHSEGYLTPTMLNKLQFHIENTITKALLNTDLNSGGQKAKHAPKNKQEGSSRTNQNQNRDDHHKKDGTLDQSADIAALLHDAAMEEYEEELQRREESIQHREKELVAEKFKFEASKHAAPIPATAAITTTGNDNFYTNSAVLTRLNASNAVLKLNGNAMAARCIRNIVLSAQLRKKRRAWSQLFSHMLNVREKEALDEQSKMLLYAQNRTTPREAELQADLLIEKERVKKTNIKMVDLQNELDVANITIEDLKKKLASASSRASLLSKGSEGIRESDYNQSGKGSRVGDNIGQFSPYNNNNNKEGELIMLLKTEQDKAVVNNARYNTLRNKTEKEVNQLKEQIQQLQQQQQQQQNPAASGVVRANMKSFSDIEKRGGFGGSNFNRNFEAAAASVPPPALASTQQPLRKFADSSTVTSLELPGSLYEPYSAAAAASQPVIPISLSPKGSSSGGVGTTAAGAAASTFKLRESLHNRYVASEPTEDDLMAIVEQRMAYRTHKETDSDNEEMQMEAMASLANELAAVLTS